MNSPTAGNGAAFVSRCAAAHGKSRLMARRRFNYRDDCDLESAFLPLNGNAVGPNMNHRPGMRSSTFVAPAPRNEICSCSPRSIRVRGESSIRHDFYLSLSLSRRRRRPQSAPSLIAFAKTGVGVMMPAIHHAATASLLTNSKHTRRQWMDLRCIHCFTRVCIRI